MKNFKELVNFCFSDMVLMNKKIDDIWEMEVRTNKQIKTDEEIYQMYAVDLANSEDNIIGTLNQYGEVLLYDERLDCYFFPVFHYGTPWESIKLNKN